MFVILIVGFVVMVGDWVGFDFVFVLMVGFFIVCCVIIVKEFIEGFF